MVSPEIAIFAERVRRALGHLSVEQVADLTDGLEANIAASVADGAALPDVDTYVAELLSAAGLAIPDSVDVGRLKIAERIATLKHVLRGLVPMWWLVRAIAATLLIGIITSTDPAWGTGRVMIHVSNNLLLGWVVLVAAIVGSVWAGRMEKRLPATLRVIPGLVIVALSLSAVGNELDFAAMMDRPQRLACVELGFDSMGRRRFPTDPFPEFVGMSLYDADQAIATWGQGWATLSLTRGMELAMSPRAKIVRAQPAYIDMSGGCPTVNIQVEIAEVDDGFELTTTIASTTTSIQLSVVPETTTSVVVQSTMAGSSSTALPPTTQAAQG